MTAATRKAVFGEETISCGIPGHDHPGQEVLAEHFEVNEPLLLAVETWDMVDRCAALPPQSHLP